MAAGFRVYERIYGMQLAVPELVAVLAVTPANSATFWYTIYFLYRLQPPSEISVSTVPGGDIAP